jgi:7-cyano-7-deazaguanine tRNA-ribosyltransferase
LSFEIRFTDLAARIGRLETAHGVLETPAFIPVVHPVRQAISSEFLKDLGFNGVITNAYIALRHYGDEARKRGIHNIIKYDGIIMTDSGGYQVLEYGSIGIDPAIIAQFQKDIKSDICVPLDKPTGRGLKYETAKEYVDQTLKNAKETLEIVSAGKRDNNTTNKADPIWVGPIQGSEHSDLVKYSADTLDQMGFRLLALGSPVELMEAYEFATLSYMIATTKRSIPSKPLHLFGAGHPLTIPLVVALGCDMFDSASYMLYARFNRYMHKNGISRLEDLSYLICPCQICSTYTIKELVEMEKDKRTIEIAKHNLYVLKSEISSVKQAIIDGKLWEYIMQKAHCHPKLMEATQLFKNFEFLESGTPLFKEKAVFLYDPIDQYRPEALRFRRMTSNFRKLKNKKMLILCVESNTHPFYSTSDFLGIVKKYPAAQICTYNPFLGIIPVEICDIFPASHNMMSRNQKYHVDDYPSFIESLLRFISSNKFEEIIVIADNFMRNVLKDIKIKELNLKIKIFDYNRDIIS